jgi:heme-degrading monooxygenase HmoA
MFARVRITSGVPDKVDDGIRNFRETVVASYKDVAGFEGAYLLVNRRTGKVMGITLWDSEASMQATDKTSERLRAAGSHVVSGTTPPPEEYEVVVQP